MTPEEHRLVILVLARQYQQTRIIIEMLKSRGVLETDDATAFASAVCLDAPSNDALLRQAREEYLLAAKEMGVITGLET
jgi:hypothetical protein